MVFEEREHDIQMRQQRMRAQLLMSEVSTDFDIEIMRQDRARELRHRAPLAITTGPEQSTPEQLAKAIGEQPEQPPNTPIMLANTASEQQANTPLNRPNPVPEQPTIADLVREQIANTPDNATAVRNVLAVRPDANKESVAAAVRRERKKAGPYL
jgi:phosphatidylserine/phosphatidylglycerophosphate/cardiolipin synthase-like enzyme